MRTQTYCKWKSLANQPSWYRVLRHRLFFLPPLSLILAMHGLILLTSLRANRKHGLQALSPPLHPIFFSALIKAILCTPLHLRKRSGNTGTFVYPGAPGLLFIREHRDFCLSGSTGTFVYPAAPGLLFIRQHRDFCCTSLPASPHSESSKWQPPLPQPTSAPPATPPRKKS